MDSWLRIALAILATYRLASLLATEEGPGGIFEGVRAFLGGYDIGEDGRPETSLGRGVTCPLCVGVYVALIVMLLVIWPVADIVLIWLGLAGGQMLLQQVVDRG